MGILNSLRIINIREDIVLTSEIGFRLMKCSLESLKNVNMWVSLTNMLRDEITQIPFYNIIPLMCSSKTGKTKLYCFGMYSELVEL